ncbi:MAG: rod shape-determining protein MreD [Symbiobacteriaceae bacterium]|nr:rod shape-determining protein MreD [Symbiobacteriaceae bacterium]
MTKRIFLSTITLLIFLCQTTVLPQLLLYRFRIDLLLLWVVSYGLLTSAAEGLRFGLLVGLFYDLAIGFPFALHTLVKGVAGFLAGILANTFFREQLRLPLIIQSAAITLQEVALFTWHFMMFGSHFPWDDQVSSELILLLLYSLCFAALIYRLTAHLVSWLERTAYERSERK